MAELKQRFDTLNLEVAALRLDVSDFITVHPKLRELLVKHDLNLKIEIIDANPPAEPEPEVTPELVEPAPNETPENKDEKGNESNTTPEKDASAADSSTKKSG